jgi:hypothetical protein
VAKAKKNCHTVFFATSPIFRVTCANEKMKKRRRFDAELLRVLENPERPLEQLRSYLRKSVFCEALCEAHFYRCFRRPDIVAVFVSARAESPATSPATYEFLFNVLNLLDDSDIAADVVRPLSSLQLLLEAKVEVTERALLCSSDSIALLKMLEYSTTVRDFEYGGAKALHHALYHNLPAVVRRLLGLGARFVFKCVNALSGLVCTMQVELSSELRAILTETSLFKEALNAAVCSCCANNTTPLNQVCEKLVRNEELCKASYGYLTSLARFFVENGADATGLTVPHHAAFFTACGGSDRHLLELLWPATQPKMFRWQWNWIHGTHEEAPYYRALFAESFVALEFLYEKEWLPDSIVVSAAADASVSTLRFILRLLATGKHMPSLTVPRAVEYVHSEHGSPLMAALRTGNPDSIIELLQVGARAHCDGSELDNGDYGLLEYCARTLYIKAMLPHIGNQVADIAIEYTGGFFFDIASDLFDRSCCGPFKGKTPRPQPRRRTTWIFCCGQSLKN